MTDYNKRLVEVDEILKYLSDDELAKIPDDIKQLIKENKDKDYTWKYDETKELKDQNLSCDTIAFLSYLNMEYLLDEEQKKLMQEIHELNERKVEKSKIEKQANYAIFSKNNLEAKKVIEEDQEQHDEKALMQYKENFITRIKNKIREFLGLNKKKD